MNENNLLALESNVVAQVFSIPVDPNLNLTRPLTSILTSVDLWFRTIDDRTSLNQATVEVRETVNGYPGGIDRIVGTSGVQILNAANATNEITSATAVNFKFRAPIKVISGRDYALVVKTPSEMTEIYIANIGGDLLDGTGTHSSTNNVGNSKGSFFISQRRKTWVADFNRDLTFSLKRARFTNDATTVTLSNTPNRTGFHNGDIGAYSRGLAIETYINTRYVKVIHPNHGLNHNNAMVTITGLVATDMYNGIPGSEINGQHSVEFATLNSYFIRVTSSATRSGMPTVPVFQTFATQNLVFDALMTNIPILKEQADDVTVRLRTTDTNSVVLQPDSVTNTVRNTAVDTPILNQFMTTNVNQTLLFDTPQIVRSQDNATTNADLVLELTLYSGSPYSSPYFKNDSTINPLLFRNIVGRPIREDEVYGTNRVLTTETLLAPTDINPATSVVFTDAEYLAHTQQYVSYQAAIQSISENSAYVTRAVDLEVPASGFTVIFDADMEPSSRIEVSYKTRGLGDDTAFEDLQWIDFDDNQQITEANYGVFSTNANTNSYELRADGLNEFTSFKIRFRLIAENEALTPKMSDLRIIADL